MTITKTIKTARQIETVRRRETRKSREERLVRYVHFIVQHGSPQLQTAINFTLSRFYANAKYDLKYPGEREARQKKRQELQDQLDAM